MKTINKFLISIMFLLLSSGMSLVYGAAMADYCAVPPYIQTNIAPNIMLYVDTSCDMAGPAYHYTGSSGQPYVAGSNYMGIYMPTPYYIYNASPPEWRIASTQPPGAGFTCISDYYCTNNGGVTKYFRGAFLNYITASRYDVLMKILIGGYGSADATGNITQANSNSARPCNAPISCNNNADCTPYGAESYCSHGSCIIGENEWEWTDSASGCKFEVEWSTSHPELEIEGEDTNHDGVPDRVCAVTGASAAETEGLVQVSLDKYSSGASLPAGMVTKTGLVQEFYNQAKWGFSVIDKVSGTTLGAKIVNCISSSNPTIQSFINSISSPSNTPDNLLIANLATGYYGISRYFEQAAAGSDYKATGCGDPFAGDTTTCRKNFVLTLSSAYSTRGTTYGASGTCTDPTKQLEHDSCYSYVNDLRPGISGTQNLYHYGVFTMGLDGESAMSYTTPITSSVPTANTRGVNRLKFRDATNKGGGTAEAQTQYFEAPVPDQLEQAIRDAILAILKRVASGTAASVLASGEGSGANLVQATFYPRRKFYNSATSAYDEIMWTGRLSNLWYYIDPFFTNSGIYEDNASSGILNTANDNKVTLYFDSALQKTMASRSLNGTALTPDIEIEKLTNLWEAGVELWKRDVTTGSGTRVKRKIYTTVNGTSLLAGNFSADTVNGDSDNSANLLSYLNMTDLNGDALINSADATILIRYTHGEDFSAYSLRPRTVAVDLNNNGSTLDAGESAKVWKLGDVVDATPRISSWMQLNTYDSIYGDTTYTDFLNSANYTGRGMVFAGANDGMLHAFKLGKLEVKWSGQGATEFARLTNPDATTPLGHEVWAFIPKNTLPYLNYMARQDYCHVYGIDLAPYLFDASINGAYDATKTSTSWRTILIGGMRYGGACRVNTSACTDCVKTPLAGQGYSSYFALDITDQNNPTLLWEFSNENLGFSTAGPAIVRIGADKTKNGSWFVVLGSGPTGPIDATSQQFLGKSDQNLRLFVLDLRTGALQRTIDTGLASAFAGSMLNATNDTDLNYQDDVVYIPYVKLSGGTWTSGGVSRLLTKEDANPNNWAWSTVIDNIGPVTSAVARLQNKSAGKMWLYFGEGRYFYKASNLTPAADDASTTRRLFGIKDPCFSTAGFNTSCTSTVSVPSEASAAAATCTGTEADWKITLEAAAGSLGAERDITDPLALTSGLLFFTTYKPYTDVCSLGGKTYVWATNYCTGGAAGAALKGKAMIQVSTGSIEQKDLSTAFTEMGNRRTSAMEGQPPTAQGLSILSQPPPIKRVIHMKER